jgi:peptide chain release factor 1
MRLGDVVDQFHDQNGLAHAGAAEQADLAALGVGRQQVDDLDAGDEDLRFRRLLDKAGAAWWMARVDLVLPGRLRRPARR